MAVGLCGLVYEHCDIKSLTFGGYTPEGSAITCFRGVLLLTNDMDMCPCKN